MIILENVVQPPEKILRELAALGNEAVSTNHVDCCTHASEREAITLLPDEQLTYDYGEADITQATDQPYTGGNMSLFEELLQSLIIEKPERDIQKAHNNNIKELKEHYLDAMCHTFDRHLDTYNNMWQSVSKQGSAVTSASPSAFATNIHNFNAHLTFAEFPQRLRATLYRLNREILEHFVKSVQLQSDNIEQQCTNLYSTVSGRGTLRRIGGRTLHLVQKLIRSKLYSAATFQDNILANSLKKKLDHLTYLMTSQEAVHCGKYPETAEETDRKQYVSGGLTYIKDNCFEFFLDVEQVRAEGQSIKQALHALHGQTINAETENNLLVNMKLKEQFLNMYSDYKRRDANTINYLYTQVIKKYLPVTNNSFRMRVIEHLNVAREQQALRASLKSINKKQVHINRYLCPLVL